MVVYLTLTLALARSAAYGATVVVNPSNMQGWAFVQEVATATGSMVNGPSTPAMGVGSARMTLDASGRELLGTLAYAGTRLDNITALQYSTYRTSFDSGNNLAISLQFDIDYDLTDSTTTWQGRLVFEPYFTPASVPQNTWQTWDPLAGKWWGSGTPIVGNTPLAQACPQSLPCTWGQVLANYADAGLRAGIGVLQFKAGGPWAGFDGNVDAFTITTSGTTTFDFEPCASLPEYVAPTGSDAINDCTNPVTPCATIQHAIDAACAGNTINVRPGTYSETAPMPSPPGCSGDTVGLYIGTNGLTIQGVTAGDVPIITYAGVLATVNTNSNLCFGPDGIFVQGDNVTIAGIRVGPNTGGQNKTIEVVGDNFTLKNCDVSDVQGSVYINDSNVTPGMPPTSHVQSYRIEGNNFEDGVSLDIASGAGLSGLVSGRVITGNTFNNLATTAGSQAWPSITFNGSDTGVPWFVYSVGGAVITGNTFTNSAPDGQHIRARGTYDNSQFDWATYFTANTFNKSVVFGPAPPGNLGTFSYPNFYGIFDNVRRIGAIIQGEVDHAQNGDTVLVGTGTYVEAVNIPTPLTLEGLPGAVIKPDNTTPLLDGGIRRPAVYVASVDDVTVKTIEIDGTGGTVHCGIYFFNSNNSTADSNVIHDLQNDVGDVAGTGILFFGWGQGTDGALVHGNTVYNTPRMGIFVGGMQSSDPYNFLPSSNNAIKNNTVHHTWQGPTSDGGGAVQINAGNESSFETNSIHDTGLNQRAIYMSVSASQILITGNTIMHSGSGPAIQHFNCCGGNPSGDLTITNNDITATSPGGDGSMVDLPNVGGSSGFSGNTVTLAGSAPPSFFHGLNLSGASTGAWAIANNVFDGNGLGASSVGIRLRNSLPATSAISITCNRIQDWANGIRSDGLANASLVQVHNNALSTNSVNGFLDGGSAVPINAENNWWGCPTGPYTGGCNNAAGDIDFVPFTIEPPACVTCTQNADCDDLNPCNGVESCNVGTGSCMAGTEVPCNDGNLCTADSCDPGTGNCIHDAAARNGFACNDANKCTTIDTCQNGTCVGGGGADSDGDGYCDIQEIQAGCNPDPPDGFFEIPPQANVYSGGRGSSGGEILLTYRAPVGPTVTPASDPSCTTTAGACTFGFCSSGKVSDPCSTASDCNYTPSTTTTTCRVVINYAKTDLTLLEAKLRIPRQPVQDLNLPSIFQPLTPGCSRKVDITLPSGFKRATLKLKASGTTSGRMKKDRDRIKYKQ